MNRDLLEAALRVLNAHVSGRGAVVEDVARLRELAAGPDRNLPPDILAARIIGGEIERGRARRRGAGADSGTRIARGVCGLLD